MCMSSEDWCAGSSEPLLLADAIKYQKLTSWINYIKFQRLNLLVFPQNDTLVMSPWVGLKNGATTIHFLPIWLSLIP